MGQIAAVFPEGYRLSRVPVRAASFLLFHALF